MRLIEFCPVCCSQRKSCMRHSLGSTAQASLFPSPGLSTCVTEEGSLGPGIKRKEQKLHSWLDSFHVSVVWVRLTTCGKGWGVGAPIFTFCRRAPVFACAERVTGLSWSLLISYQQQNLLVHEIWIQNQAAVMDRAKSFQAIETLSSECTVRCF